MTVVIRILPSKLLLLLNFSLNPVRRITFQFWPGVLSSKYIHDDSNKISKCLEGSEILVIFVRIVQRVLS